MTCTCPPGTLTTDELVAVGVAPPNTTSLQLLNAEQKVKEDVRKADLAKEAQAQMKEMGKKPEKEEAKIASTTTSTAGLTAMIQSPGPISLVLGCCHSCVIVDGKIAGMSFP